MKGREIINITFLISYKMHTAKLVFNFLFKMFHSVTRAMDILRNLFLKGKRDNLQ